MSRKCANCKEVKALSEFYKKGGVVGGSPYCKVCTNIQAISRQRALKLKAVDYMGGECACCGYKKYIGALEFHHLDPSKKDFSISKAKSQSFDRVKPELDKCVLLCANCHREWHTAIADGGDITWNLDISAKVEKPTGVDLESYKRPQKSTKMDSLTDEDLHEIVWKYPKTHLAKVWGISESSIVRRLKARNIKQPPRGYWSKTPKKE